MDEWFDIMATKGNDSEILTDNTHKDFQREQRRLFQEGYQTLRVYRYTKKNGFDKVRNYIRTKDGWGPL